MPRGEFSVGRLLATPASYAYQKILFKYLKKDEPKIFIPSMRYAHHFIPDVETQTLNIQLGSLFSK